MPYLPSRPEEPLSPPPQLVAGRQYLTGSLTDSRSTCYLPQKFGSPVRWTSVPSFTKDAMAGIPEEQGRKEKDCFGLVEEAGRVRPGDESPSANNSGSAHCRGLNWFAVSGRLKSSYLANMENPGGKRQHNAYALDVLKEHPTSCGTHR